MPIDTERRQVSYCNSQQRLDETWQKEARAVAALDNRTGLQAPYRSLWPLLAVLAVEGFALGLAAATTPLQGTRFSVAVAMCVLLPAFLRPSAESALAACMATLMVSLLVVPFDRTMLPQAMPGIPLTSLPWFLVLRLANGATLAPLSLHLAARFPQRAAGASHHALSNRTLAWCYRLTWALVVALLLAPTAWSRVGAFVLLVGCSSACSARRSANLSRPAATRPRRISAPPSKPACCCSVSRWPRRPGPRECSASCWGLVRFPITSESWTNCQFVLQYSARLAPRAGLFLGRARRPPGALPADSCLCYNQL